MKPIRSLQRLKVLYMSHNYVREWREFEHLSELPVLEDLVFIGNPIEEDAASAGKYTEEVIKRLLYLKKLDGFPVIRESDGNDDEEVSSTLGIEEIENMAKYSSSWLDQVSTLFCIFIVNFTGATMMMIQTKPAFRMTTEETMDITAMVATTETIMMTTEIHSILLSIMRKTMMKNNNLLTFLKKTN
jgi:hypothetical protein